MQRLLFCVLFVVALAPALVWPVAAQHNGQQLAFQGLSRANDLGVRAIGRGGTGAAERGFLGSIFTNPAGLAGLTGLRIGVSAKYVQDYWQEEQVWYQNRYYPVVPFLMEGLYTPDPEHDGIYYDSLLASVIDPAEIESPVMGEEVFSEARADWSRSRDRIPLNSIAAAVPFRLAGRSFVLAGAYARRYDVSNFDRNDTYLDPHIGILTDEMVTPSSDTLRVNWWRYSRSRQGGIGSFMGALSVEAANFLDVGVTVSYLSGSTDDALIMDQYGVLEFVDRDNAFAHSDNLREVLGSSDFSALAFGAGILLRLGKLQAGATFRLPHDIERSWTYDRFERQDGSETRETTSGTDLLRAPASFTVGLRIEPRSDFILFGDVGYVPNGSASFTLANPSPLDTTYRAATAWVNQASLGVGAEYRPIDRLTLRAGYRRLSEPFVAAGAANRESGPGEDAYSLGLSIEVPYGRIDIAYQHRRLGYWDSYQTNTNYTLRRTNQVLVGFAVVL